MNTGQALFPDGAALVFGGSGGIGSAICRELANHRCNIVLTYNKNFPAADEVRNEVNSQGGQAEAAQIYCTNINSVRSVIDNTIAKYKRIHSVFIALGSDIEQKYVSQITPEEWKSVVYADIDCAFNIIHCTLPHLRVKGGGSYVHISSAGLLRWHPMDILSVAPKDTIQALIRGVAREEGRHNIRANSIALGVIKTGLFMRLKESIFDKQWEKSALSTLALKRFGESEEVANMAVFLASSKAGYTTGQLIAVDGGFSI